MIQNAVAQLVFKEAKMAHVTPLFISFTFTFMHFADAFIQSDSQCIQAIHLYCQYMCVPWESNPQPLRC